MKKISTVIFILIVFIPFIISILCYNEELLKKTQSATEGGDLLTIGITVVLLGYYFYNS